MFWGTLICIFSRNCTQYGKIWSVLAYMGSVQTGRALLQLCKSPFKYLICLVKRRFVNCLCLQCPAFSVHYSAGMVRTLTTFLTHPDIHLFLIEYLFGRKAVCWGLFILYWSSAWSIQRTYTLFKKKCTFNSSIFPGDPGSGSVTLGHA